MLPRELIVAHHFVVSDSKIFIVPIVFLFGFSFGPFLLLDLGFLYPEGTKVDFSIMS
jgi:hypothetical protein